LPGEGRRLGFLPNLQICEFSKGDSLKELRTSNAVEMYTIVVQNSKCITPSYMGVGRGLEHGTHLVCLRAQVYWPKTSVSNRGGREKGCVISFVELYSHSPDSKDSKIHALYVRDPKEYQYLPKGFKSTRVFILF
jgi:hypothetical protein